MKKLSLAIVLFVSLFFAGCFEILEEVWINNDGSGRIKIDIGISEAMMSMGTSDSSANTFADLDKDFQKTKEEVEKNPKIKRVDFKQYSDGGMKHFAFDVEVRDLSALNDFQKIVYSSEKKDTAKEASAEQGMPLENSELTIEKQNGKIVFVRRIGQKPATEDTSTSAEGDSAGKAFEDMGKAMAGAMFGNFSYTVRLHADNISSTNGKLDDQKKTVEWKIPLGELMTGKHRELRAEIVPAGGNMVMWIVAALVILGVVVGVVTMMRRKKEVPPMPQA